MLTCKACGYSMIGERQRGEVYYRCHTRACATVTIREEPIEEAALDCLRPLQFSPEEKALQDVRLAKLRGEQDQVQQQSVDALKLRLAQIDTRLNRLTDALIDGVLERDAFELRKGALLLERQ